LCALSLVVFALVFYCAGNKIYDSAEDKREIKVLECAIKNSIQKANSWKQIRHIPADLTGWSRSSDNMTGSEEYGNKENAAEAWAVKFDHLGFERVKVESQNHKYCKEYSKAEFLEKKD